MPGGWKVTRTDSLINNTCVFGSMPGLQAQTGTRRLEFKNGGIDMKNHMSKYYGLGCAKVEADLKKAGLWEYNKMTGGVGKVPVYMFRSQLRW